MDIGKEGMGVSLVGGVFCGMGQMLKLEGF